MLRVQERKQQRDGDRFHARLSQFLHEPAQVVFIKRLDYFARCNYTLANTEPQIIVDEWRRLDRVEIVELRTRLPSDNKHVFKTFRGDQCEARATALQQSVRADSRAVYNLDVCESSAGFSADSREALLDCERRIGRSRGKFEKLNAPVSFENEIGERSARVDADAYDVT